MAIAHSGGLSLNDVIAIRTANPSHSFSGVYVSPQAYQWLTTNRPGMAVPNSEPMLPSTAQAAAPVTGIAAPAEDPTGAPYPAPDPGGGPGYSVASGVPAYDPNNDPTFQQLMRQLALQETNYRNQAATAQAQAQENAAILSPRVAQAGIQQRQNLNNQFEERGTFRSGLRLNDLALQRQSEQQKLADIQRRAATSVAATNATLNTNLGDLANQRANAQLQANLRAGSNAAGGSTAAAVA